MRFLTMMGRWGAAVGTFGAAAVLGSACAAQLPLPERAARLEASACRDEPPADQERRALEGAAVLSARSACVADYCAGAFQVTAVKLVVRPPVGVTADGYARTLRCHNLRVMDGEVDESQIADDPYGLRDSWLDIDVKPSEGNLVVTLNGDRVADNLRILHRAKAFAAAHRAGILR